MLHRIPLPIPILLVVACGVFLPGINWGLPAQRAAVDPFLFGKHARWSGSEIMMFAGPTEDPNRGADVASHPGTNRTGVVVVNATDEERARIIRRYRLMSYQPDEWNTLKALSEMKPRQGNFDPKLYQYGGLWVYPVGALLKIAATLHLIDLRGEITWYLDHPHEFGRFYVVARLWSVFWALIGVCAVYALVRRIVGGWKLPMAAGGCFIFMPVVVNMSHEAKPHLPGAVLMLLTILAAARYVERRRHSGSVSIPNHRNKSRFLVYTALRQNLDWILAGVFCGAAIAMVLSTLPVLLVLPAMVSMRTGNWRQKMLACGGALFIAILVYLITNPYVPINFIHHRSLLESNLGNSQAMYHARLTGGGIANAAYLIAAGTSPLLAIAGAGGAIALGIRAVRFRKNRESAEIRRRATGLLLALPAFCVAGQCIAFATAKPGEFGRFMLLPDIFLMIEAMVFLGTPWRNPAPSYSGERAGVRGGLSSDATRSMAPHPNPLPRVRGRGDRKVLLAVALLIATAVSGLIYVRAFVRDSRSVTSRLIGAKRLRQLTRDGGATLAIDADPAPYCLPPADLFGAPILLVPKGIDQVEEVKLANVSIRVDDGPINRRWFMSLWSATPISWADKPFVIRTR